MRFRVAAAFVLLLIPCLAVAGLCYAHNDDTNQKEFVILANAHYDTTTLSDLAYEDANWVYDTLKGAHGWTCIDYKAWDTTDHGDCASHSTLPTAHDPNYYGDRPEAVAETIYNTHFYYDGSYDADSADLFYFMGHGWNSLATTNGTRYGVLGLHKVKMSPPSNSEEYFSPQLVGSGWSGDLEWGVLAACSALYYSSSSPSTSGAQYFADAMAYGMHGFVGYRSTAPGWPTDEDIAERFISNCFGDPYRQLDPMTIREAWVEANVYYSQSSRWACLFHDDNENDYLPGSGYSMGADSHNRNDIYFWSSSTTRAPVQDTALHTEGGLHADSAAQPDREASLGIANRLIEDARALESGALGATVLYSGDGLAHAIVYESGALEFRRGALLGDGKPVAKDDALNMASRFVTNGGGLPSDAVSCSVTEIRRTRVGQPHASSESIAWAVEYRQVLGSLPVYGQNVIRVLVTAGGVTAYDRMWLPASSTPSSETLPSEAEALAQALQAVDRCQGTPDVVGLERCLWRESVRRYPDQAGMEDRFQRRPNSIRHGFRLPALAVGHDWGRSRASHSTGHG